MKEIYLKDLSKEKILNDIENIVIKCIEKNFKVDGAKKYSFILKTKDDTKLKIETEIIAILGDIDHLRNLKIQEL